MSESPTVIGPAIDQRAELSKRKRRLETLGNFGKGVAQSASDSIQSGEPVEVAAASAREVFAAFVARSGLAPDSLDSELALAGFERHLADATGVSRKADSEVNGEI